jgi:hypothetical protein
MDWLIALNNARITPEQCLNPTEQRLNITWSIAEQPLINHWTTAEQPLSRLSYAWICPEQHLNGARTVPEQCLNICFGVQINLLSMAWTTPEILFRHSSSEATFLRVCSGPWVSLNTPEYFYLLRMIIYPPRSTLQLNVVVHTSGLSIFQD